MRNSFRLSGGSRTVGDDKDLFFILFVSGPHITRHISYI